MCVWRFDMQIDPKDLKAAVNEALTKGILTEKLASMAMEIVRGYLARDKFRGYRRDEIEEIFGMWTVRFVQTWDRLNPNKNPHAFITGGAAFAYRDYCRRLARRIRREHANAEAAFAEETERIQRFIRSYEADIGQSEDIRSVQDYTDFIRGGVDKEEKS